MNINYSDYTNILIIGCGGAGLSSAIEANQNNLSVKVLGKRPKNDAHTVPCCRRNKCIFWKFR